MWIYPYVKALRARYPELWWPQINHREEPGAWGVEQITKADRSIVARDSNLATTKKTQHLLIQIPRHPPQAGLNYTVLWSP